MAKKGICEECDGKCCRHIALEIDKPEDSEDFDSIRWYLCHQGVQVFVEEGKWFLQVYARCRYLDRNFRCTNYANRPDVCSSYDTDDCEGTRLDFDDELHFKSDADLEAYLARKEKRGGKP